MDWQITFKGLGFFALLLPRRISLRLVGTGIVICSRRLLSVRRSSLTLKAAVLAADSGTPYAIALNTILLRSVDSRKITEDESIEGTGRDSKTSILERRTPISARKEALSVTRSATWEVSVEMLLLSSLNCDDCEVESDSIAFKMSVVEGGF
ncbi:unnamed protein product [Macrosiphum euphorbiae]|uniref:Uncharacterized protein n=1 Tax=Macrosiphum euphorbiae TaxID=13131 RepID=A0AAV0X7J3_9HEMI|nr:unnamed protein product [Macrosiphum euphorbiae]